LLLECRRLLLKRVDLPLGCRSTLLAVRLLFDGRVSGGWPLYIWLRLHHGRLG
jgi:hypothetical protein